MICQYNVIDDIHTYIKIQLTAYLLLFSMTYNLNPILYGVHSIETL